MAKGDRNVLYVDCGSDFMAIYISQNFIESYTLSG